MTATSDPGERQRLSRRAMLAGLETTAHSLRARVDEPRGIVALDRRLATTLLALGVTDVGLLFMPNEELIYELHPDLILIPPPLAPESAVLARTGALAVFNLAPVVADPYLAAQAETKRLAAGRPPFSRSSPSAPKAASLRRSLPSVASPSVCCARPLTLLELDAVGARSLLAPETEGVMAARNTPGEAVDPVQTLILDKTFPESRHPDM